MPFACNPGPGCSIDPQHAREARWLAFDSLGVAGAAAGASAGPEQLRPLCRADGAAVAAGRRRGQGHILVLACIFTASDVDCVMLMGVLAEESTLIIGMAGCRGNCAVACEV